MSYAEVNGTHVVNYPFTFSTLQMENPYTNYGDNQNFTYWFPLTDAATINGHTLVQVRQLTQPTIDPATQNAVPNNTPEFIEGEWVDGWTVTEKTPEEQAAYIESIKNSNRNQADQLLNQTDWASIPAVADPAQSNPYLTNQDAFLEYRSQVREIAVNPPATPVTAWPTIPPEQWSTAS